MDRSPPPIDPKASILAALDEIKAGIESGVITSFGALIINNHGTMMGTNLVMYPPTMNPLEMLGMGKAFEAACTVLVYTPFNPPQNKVLN